MFDFTDINHTDVTGAEAMYIVKTRLKAAGATVPSSSDGTTYSSSGDIITSGASGANGLANAGAWVRIRLPEVDGEQREFTIERGAANTDWRIKYSKAAGFTGGSPGATATPTASDQEILAGGGTDGSPSYSVLFGADDGYVFNFVVGGEAEGYSFFSLAWPDGGGTCTHAWIFDRVWPGHPEEDADPYVHAFANPSNDLFSTAVLADAATGAFPNPRCWYKAGLAGEDFVGVAGCYLRDAAGNVAPAALGENAHNGNTELVPVLWARRSALTAPTGLKGWSRLLEWQGSARANQSTLSVGGGEKNRIIAGTIALPWVGDGTDPTV